MHSDDIAARLRGVELPDSAAAEERTVALARERAAVSEAESARTSRRPRIFRLLALSGVGALAVTLVMALAATGGGEDPAGTGSFGSFAAIAAQQSSKGFERVESQSRLRYRSPSRVEVDDSLELELWVGENQRFERSDRSFLDGARTGGGVSEYLFDRADDRLCVRKEGRPEGSRKAACAPLQAIGPDAVESLWDRYELPEDPIGLRAEVDRWAEEFRGRSSEDEFEPADCIAKTPQFAFPVPESLTAGSRRQDLTFDLKAVDGTNTQGGGFSYQIPGADLRFIIVSNLLTSPHASPGLRAAAFKVLGGLEGAELEGDGSDRLGRPAAVVSFRPPAPPGGDPTTLDEVFFDPETSEALERRTTVSSDGRKLGSYYEVFRERERVAELPEAAAPLEADLRRSIEAEGLSSERRTRC